MSLTPEEIIAPVVAAGRREVLDTTDTINNPNATGTLPQEAAYPAILARRDSVTGDIFDLWIWVPDAAAANGGMWELFSVPMMSDTQSKSFGWLGKHNARHFAPKVEGWGMGGVMVARRIRTNVTSIADVPFDLIDSTGTVLASGVLTAEQSSVVANLVDSSGNPVNAFNVADASVGFAVVPTGVMLGVHYQESDYPSDGEGLKLECTFVPA